MDLKSDKITYTSGTRGKEFGTGPTHERKDVVTFKIASGVTKEIEKNCIYSKDFTELSRDQKHREIRKDSFKDFAHSANWRALSSKSGNELRDTLAQEHGYTKVQVTKKFNWMKEYNMLGVTEVQKKERAKEAYGEHMKAQGEAREKFNERKSEKISDFKGFMKRCLRWRAAVSKR